MNGMEESWPHAPPHWLLEAGTYFVTAATYRKEHFMRSRKRLRFFQQQLLERAAATGWRLEAWAVFSNHYHFIAKSPEDGGDGNNGPESLPGMLKRIHGATSRFVNQLDQTPGRKIWHNYRETRLTFEKSYLARLNYVHQNPVKHGLVLVANQYPWCSAAWFEGSASDAQVRTIYGFKIDRVVVEDDYEVYRG